MVRPRVLVVDDDVDLRRMLVDYLSAHDYDVSASSNGAEMRSAIEHQVPDVVLLDVGLPGEDGLTLALTAGSVREVGRGAGEGYVAMLAGMGSGLPLRSGVSRAS